MGSGVLHVYRYEGTRIVSYDLKDLIFEVDKVNEVSQVEYARNIYKSRKQPSCTEEPYYWQT